MAGRWVPPSERQRMVQGRRAPVAQRYRRVGGVWVPSDEHYRWLDVGGGPEEPPPPPPPPPGDLPAPPTGYKSWYEIDFRDIGTRLPAPWVAQNSGGGNSGGTYRAQNVAVIPGKGLVHYAERASVGAPMYTGKVYGRLGVPQFCHLRYRARIVGAAEGIWPSFWRRPQTANREGEIDDLEVFFGHLYPNQSRGPRIFGGGYILTPYPRKGQAKVDMDSIIGGLDSQNRITDRAKVEGPHVYETRQTPGNGATFWVDEKLVGTINKQHVELEQGTTRAQANTMWDQQFESDTRWYLRTDFQLSYDSQSDAGRTNAGDLSPNQVGRFAEWIIEYVQVFVPNSYSGPEPTI